jgi:hypothetical protein
MIFLFKYIYFRLNYNDTVGTYVKFFLKMKFIFKAIVFYVVIVILFFDNYVSSLFMNGENVIVNVILIYHFYMLYYYYVNINDYEFYQ